MHTLKHFTQTLKTVRGNIDVTLVDTSINNKLYVSITRKGVDPQAFNYFIQDAYIDITPINVCKSLSEYLKFMETKVVILLEDLLLKLANDPDQWISNTSDLLVQILLPNDFVTQRRTLPAAVIDYKYITIDLVTSVGAVINLLIPNIEISDISTSKYMERIFTVGKDTRYRRISKILFTGNTNAILDKINNPIMRLNVEKGIIAYNHAAFIESIY